MIDSVTGNVMVNVVPLPGVVSTRSVPFSRSMDLRTTSQPTPRPETAPAMAFVLIVASALFGAVLRRKVPHHHLEGDSKDVIKLATALIGTMAALVLALLFADTRTSFENTSAVEPLVVLRYFGPEVHPDAPALGAYRKNKF